MYEFTNDRPIYLQLVDAFKNAVIAGQWQADQKIPSVRDLALTFGVNPNTVQRALAILEDEGLLRSERTTGRFVNDNQKQIDDIKQNEVLQKTVDYIASLKYMGCSKAECLQTIEREWGPEDDSGK